MDKKMNNLKRIIAVSIALLLSITTVELCVYFKDEDKQYDYKDVVVFYPQHQDDEVLWAGSAIIEAIKQKGEENVFVVLVSDGSGIKILQDEKFSGLSRSEKAQLRKNEFKKSLSSLGVLEENITFLDEINGDPSLKFDTMKQVTLDFESKFNGDVTHVSHTYELDWHEQHLKNGQVIKDLYDEGKINSCLFFIKPEYQEEIPIEKRVDIEAKTQNDYNKIKEACNAYKLEDEENGYYGIGYKSDHKSFDRLLSNEKAMSILHSPEL